MTRFFTFLDVLTLFSGWMARIRLRLGRVQALALSIDSQPSVEDRVLRLEAETPQIAPSSKPERMRAVRVAPRRSAALRGAPGAMAFVHASAGFCGIYSRSFPMDLNCSRRCFPVLVALAILLSLFSASYGSLSVRWALELNFL